MKTALLVLPLLCLCTGAAAQSEKDSADIYYRHLDLDELVVSSPVGQMKRKHSPTPVSVVTQRELRQTAASSIVDAVARQPGVDALTSGSGIAKPVIRGLGYNRVVSVADGVRQEGQQWGDEHGLEIDPAAVRQVEILKGPASLMYGSDAMAGVVIFQPDAIEAEDSRAGSFAAGYQSNSGLASASLRLGGNRRGLVWNGRYSERAAHAYKNSRDGYVPGTQFHERAAGALVGVNRGWGFSHLTLSAYRLTPSLAEGERDELTGLLTGGARHAASYRKSLPYQQIGHYKAVLDNSIGLGAGLLKAVAGWQLNRRQEFELPAEAELDFRLHTLTYDLRYVLPRLGAWKLTAGAGGMVQRSDNLGEEALIPAYSLWDVGAFATAVCTLGRWTFSGGLRADRRSLAFRPLAEDGGSRRHDAFDALSGSAGAVYSPGRNLSLRANIARGFRAPNLSELGSDGVHEGTLRYEIGNPGLRAEHSWQADLGADVNCRWLSAQAALFASRISHFIFAAALPEAAAASRPDALAEGLPLYAYTQGSALLKGLEAGADIHPIHQLHIGASFCMVGARLLHQSADSRYLPRTPAHRLSAEVKWEFVHNGDHHAATGHHAREREAHHPIDHLLDNAFVSLSLTRHFRQNHCYLADHTETPTPAYTLLGATLGTDVLRRGRKLCELYLVGENLLDCAYQSHLSRLKYTDVDVRTGRQGVCNPGRNVALKAIFPFRF